MAFGDYVQSDGVDSGDGTTRELAYPSNNTAGNMLFLVARFAIDPGVITISDTNTNTWGIQHRVAGGTNVGIVYRALTCAGGANTVTLANTVSAICRWAILEYEGPGTQDDEASDTGVSTFAVAAALITTVARELIFVGLTTGGDVTFTPAPTLTQRVAVGARLIAADRVVTVTGNYTPSCDVAPEELWIWMTASYYAAATGVTYAARERGNRGLNRGINVGVG